MKTRLRPPRRRPEPWQPSPFAVAAGLLREPRFGEALLEPLQPQELQLDRLLPEGRPRAKSSWQPPLFPLLPRKAFELAERILARWQNPYLSFARDVKEFRLSRALYERRPDLPARVLARVHLATLLARELLQADPAAGAGGDKHGLSLLLEAYVAQAQEE